MASIEARSALQKDMVYRHWAALHGGVYAPVTALTPPNPHLKHVKERDIITPSGRALTLINPAYMTRQVFQLDEELYGAYGHITSERFLHPTNAPDPWERRALQSFEAGALEARVTETFKGTPHLRMMLPMKVKPSCLKCHAFQGYKLGELRGGLSVSVPIEPHREAAHLQLSSTAVGHGLIWLLGGLALFIVWRARGRAREEHQQAARALRASERRHQALFNEAPVPYLIVNLKGEVERANRAACALFGVALEVLEGSALFELYAEEDAARLRGTLQTLTPKSRLEGVEVSCVRADAAPRHALLSLQPMSDAEGRVKEIRIVLIDVTERHRLQEQLRQSQKLESIGQLASGVAHDFNNLLTVILGCCEMVELLPSVKEEVREEVETIKDAGERAAALVRQLLAFSRKQVLNPKALDLNAVVLGMKEILSRLLGEDIHLELILSEGLGLVRADPHQLEQVILNLAVNARDAMPEGGALRLRTYQDLLEGAELRWDESIDATACVCLALEDTGGGMDAETQARVFEPFFTTKPAGKGTGLGLSIVYGVVRQSGGALRVESALGEGSTFRIFLPYTSQERAGACAEQRAHKH